MPIDLTTPAADLGVRLIIEATTDPDVRHQVATDPTVVAIVHRTAALTFSQKQRLSAAYSQHHNTYRTVLLRTRHRVRRDGGPDSLTTRALDERVHEILDCPGGNACDPYHVCETGDLSTAVTSAIFAHLAAEFLTLDEVRLFNGPWVDIVGQVRP